jgi:hypothetical protein
LQFYNKIGVNDVEKLVEAIARPPEVLPHVRAAADASGADTNTPSSSAPVKEEEGSGERSQTPSNNIQIKVEEPQSDSNERVADSTAVKAPDTPTGGKRSREASGMHVDDTTETEEQPKKQKVEAEAEA